MAISFGSFEPGELDDVVKPGKDTMRELKFGDFDTDDDEQERGSAASSSLATSVVHVSSRRTTASPLSDVPFGLLIQTLQTRRELWQIQPRGLVNRRNMCFMNSVLQALIGCPYVVSMLIQVQCSPPPASGTPLLKLLVRFFNEFKRRPLQALPPSPRSAVPLIEQSSSAEPQRQLSKSAKKRAKRQEKATAEEAGSAAAGASGAVADSTTDLPIGEPLEPIYMSQVLQPFHSHSRKCMTAWNDGQTHGPDDQQDAQEFLGFVLDQLHGELYRIAEQAITTSNTEGSWSEMGPSKKKREVTTIETQYSHVTSLFGGRLRSVVRRSGGKETVNLQPFMILPLDIKDDAVVSVEDALQHMTQAEILDDFKSEATGMETQASKLVSFDLLPPVLLLHLKRFDFSLYGGTEKIQKHVRFPVYLNFDGHMLSKSLAAESAWLREYDLYAVISHHGRVAGAGHYTCDVRQPDMSWLEFDDSDVKLVPQRTILDRQAYILMYVQRTQPQ